MPSYRWSRLIAVLCGVGGASWGTAASAYQFPPLSDDIDTRHIHQPDAWVGGGYQTSSSNGQSPFGSNGLNDSNPFDPNGLMQSGPNAAGQNSAAGWNQTGSPFGQPPQTTAATRLKPKMSWAVDTAQQPFVGLLGQVARPGVYEIERRGTLLGDLLQNMGGLAKDASGQFRIIRNGRPGQTTSYSGAAQLELMAGDMIVADAQPSQFGQRATNAKQASADAVQIGFVNLVDRPVVLKLNSEHATVYEILSIMRQDQNLASQIKIVVPSSQRGQGQPRLDTTLASETVLIFPPYSVKTERLALLPEPFKLKRESDTKTPSGEAAQPYAPHGNISPDATQSPHSRPAVGAGTDSTPLPQHSQPISRPRVEQSPDASEVPPPPTEDTTSSKRASGVRGTPRRTAAAPDRIARDSNLLLAPPVEGSTPTPRDVPPTDVAQDNAPVPELNDSTPFDDDSRAAEPLLLNAKGKKRPIHLAKEDDSNDATLTAADLDEAEATAEKAGSSWSIWPPILTAGVGLLALIGFSLSLRRRTQTATQPSQAATTRPQPTSSAIRNSQSVLRRAQLDEIIDDQLPLTEEQVPFASPMQFHGRPQPPKTIRMDQRHALPKPHSARVPSSEFRVPSPNGRDRAPIDNPPLASAEPRTTATATQKFRSGRTGAAGTESKIVSTTAKTSSQQPTGGALDRALSAVQKQSLQKREERGT